MRVGGLFLVLLVVTLLPRIGYGPRCLLNQRRACRAGELRGTPIGPPMSYAFQLERCDCYFVPTPRAVCSITPSRNIGFI